MRQIKTRKGYDVDHFSVASTIARDKYLIINNGSVFCVDAVHNEKKANLNGAVQGVLDSFIWK
jgi:hypothetical protein